MNEQTTVTFDAPGVAGAAYLSPRDVLDDPSMTVEEKRALLASWASDARAVTDAPALRQLDNGAIVLIDDVLDALKELDLVTPRPSCATPTTRGKQAAILRLGDTFKAPRRDDDDDPPPCPVAARSPRPLPILDAAYAA